MKKPRVTWIHYLECAAGKKKFTYGRVKQIMRESWRFEARRQAKSEQG